MAPPRSLSAVAESPPPLWSWASVAHEYRQHLPIWFVYASGVGLLHAALANFPDAGFEAIGIARGWFVPLLAFPMVWFVGYFVLRIRHSTRLRSRGPAYAALVVLAVLVPALVVVGHRSYPLDHDQLTTLFEISQFLWVALFLGQIAWGWGGRYLVTFFVVTFVYGLLLENTGIVLGFFFEPSFRWYLGPLPAPLVTMAGWCLVFFVMVAVTQRLAGWLPWLASPWRRAWVATVMALCMDAQLDPLASMSGVFWRWNEQLPPAFYGVPAINFAAWFGAFLPYSYFLFRIFDREDWDHDRKNWELFLRVPLASVCGGVLCFAVMAVVEGGFDGPSFQILGEFRERLLPY